VASQPSNRKPMSLLYQRLPSFSHRAITRVLALLTVAALACDKRNLITPPSLIQVSEIEVDDGTRVLERGNRDTLTATVLDSDGDTVEVPVVWRSTNERVAIFDRGGVLVALDTGVTGIIATSLGVASAPVGYAVVWFGPAFIDSGSFSPPNARGPGVALTDSVRVIVINSDSNRVPNARVRFTVTEGDGSVSPATDSTDVNGMAATQWTLGPVAGRNVVTASVIRADGALDTLVTDNLVTFVINSYNALTVQAGDNQTAQILAELPDAPSVKLVDSLGAPRAGVPVTFTASANGRVASPIVSTGADGIASPGKWTLGETSGTQTLEARVEDAKVVLQATATGTPIFYKPGSVFAGAFTSCALETGGVVKCWGAEAQIGTGDPTDIHTPTPVQGSLVAASVAVGALATQTAPAGLQPASHNCALTSVGEAWCWGLFALVDTSGTSFHALQPTRLQSDIAWTHVSPGTVHNCGITLLEDAYCWGGNSGPNAGQLGDGTTTDRFVPTLVTGSFKFSRISSGSSHTCGLRTDGNAFCWGQNAVGQIGDGTTLARTSPTAVSGGHVFESIGSGPGHACALTPQPEGKVYCWGGLSGIAQLTPSTYAGAPAFTSLTVGGAHACALTADATAYCWGANNFGQLGDSSTTRRNSPTRVAGDLRFTQISAGFLHTCGLTTNGAVACWGNNRSGELGEPPTSAAFRTRPRHVILGVNP
jgi:hypothetical protein